MAVPVLCVVFSLLAAQAAIPAPQATEFLELAPGISYRKLPWSEHTVPWPLHVVRIDPKIAQLRVLHTPAKHLGRTAERWAQEEGLAIVINAGMFQEDHHTHTGYLRVGEQELSKRWWSAYNSVLVLKPQEAFVVDRNALSSTDFRGKKVTVVQNLRLIRGPGKNVWSKQPNRWSEAALAQNAEGDILLLFSRAPFSMRRFNQKLLKTDLNVVRAMHLEGGPEASLTINTPQLRINLAGSYETNFNENHNNTKQWRIPIVVGVSSGSAKIP